MPYPVKLCYEDSKYISYAFLKNLAISTFLKPASVKITGYTGQPVNFLPLYGLFAHQGLFNHQLNTYRLNY